MGNSDKKSSFGNKLVKTFAGGAIFWGWFSATGQTLPLPIVGFIALALIVIALYWHLLDELVEFLLKIRNYFKELKEDIKFIKEKVQIRKRVNEKNKQKRQQRNR